MVLIRGVLLTTLALILMDGMAYAQPSGSSMFGGPMPPPLPPGRYAYMGADWNNRKPQAFMIDQSGQIIWLGTLGQMSNGMQASPRPPSRKKNFFNGLFESDPKKMVDDFGDAIHPPSPQEMQQRYQNEQEERSRQAFPPSYGSSRGSNAASDPLISPVIINGHYVGTWTRAGNSETVAGTTRLK